MYMAQLIIFPIPGALFEIITPKRSIMIEKEIPDTMQTDIPPHFFVTATPDIIPLIISTESEIIFAFGKGSSDKSAKSVNMSAKAE